MLATQRFGNYRLGQMLGVGTVGSIYCATDVRTGQQVALKILLPEVSQDAKIRARFEREMMILEKLHHPHIVKYFGGGEQDGRLYYAMEIVDGGTMKDVLLEHGPLDWREVIECGRQVASALQHSHNQGVIHRDLKPSNLFLNEAGDIKLGDFGIARDTGSADLTATDITVGTYAYMSPEQISGGRQATNQSDLYSLGCVLFELLTGRPPFQGENFAQIFTQHLQKEPPTLASLSIEAPPQLERLIRQMLAKNPDDRPFNARYVQGALERVVEEVDAAAFHAPPESQETLIRRADLSRLVEPDRMSQVSLSRLAAILLLAAAATSVYWLWTRLGGA